MFFKDLRLETIPGALTYVSSNFLAERKVDYYEVTDDTACPTRAISSGTLLAYLGEQRGVKQGEIFIGAGMLGLLKASVDDSPYAERDILYVYNDHFVESLTKTSGEEAFYEGQFFLDYIEGLI